MHTAMCTAACMRQGAGSCPFLFSCSPDKMRDASSITKDTGDVGESITKMAASWPVNCVGKAAISHYH